MFLHLKKSVLLVLTFVVLSCCGEQNSKESPDIFDDRHNRIVAFVDASASADAGKKTETEFRDSLRQVVESYLPDPDDKLTVLPIHSRTVSKVGRWDTTNTLTEPDWKPLEIDRENQESRYYRRRDDFISSAQSSAVQHFESIRASPDFQDWTDIWGTLEVVSEEVSSSFAVSDTSRVKVYYFSDMYENPESSKRRNFDKNPPSSPMEATEWAKKDYERLTKYYKIEEEVLSNISVRVIPGRLAATRENARYVKYYWEELIGEQLGVKRLDYN